MSVVGLCLTENSNKLSARIKSRNILFRQVSTNFWFSKRYDEIVWSNYFLLFIKSFSQIETLIMMENMSRLKVVIEALKKFFIFNLNESFNYTIETRKRRILKLEKVIKQLLY